MGHHMIKHYMFRCDRCQRLFPMSVTQYIIKLRSGGKERVEEWCFSCVKPGEMKTPSCDGKVPECIKGGEKCHKCPTKIKLKELEEGWSKRIKE